MEPTKKWNDEAVATLTSIVGSSVDTEITVEQVEMAASALERPARNVAAKLRKMGYTVHSMAKAKVSRFDAESTAALEQFITANAGVYTYAQLAEVFPGDFTAKEIQGKLLSMELHTKVKPSEKPEAAKVYSAEQEAIIVQMAGSGAFLEDIASALGKSDSINSVRGKLLSMVTTGKIASFPAQRNKVAKKQDAFEALGDVSDKTVAEIATLLGKTERGVKTTLTKRGVDVVDYKGSEKRERLDEAA